MIPLLRDEIEILPCFGERLGIELVPTLATFAAAAYDASIFENAKMLRNGLPS